MPFQSRPIFIAATIGLILLNLSCGSALAGQFRQSDVDEEVKHLASADSSERVSAAAHLGQMGTEAKSATAQLISLLDTDESSQVRAECAHALGNIGPAAAAAIPSLIAFLQNKKCGYDRAYAPTAIGQIGLDPDKSVPALILALQSDEEPVVRELAARALGDFGAKGTSAVPTLIDAIKKGNKDLREAAACGLAKIPGKASDVPELSELLQDDVDQARSAAARSIGGAGSEAVAAVPQLAKLLSDKNVDVRISAAVGLGEIGPVAKSAIPALIAAQKDGQMRYEATQALEKIRKK